MPHRSALLRAGAAAVAGALVAVAVGSGTPRLGAAAASMALFALAIRGLRPGAAAATGLLVGGVAMGISLSFLLRGVALAGHGVLTGAATLALASALHAARFALAGGLAAAWHGAVATRRPLQGVGPGLALVPAWLLAEVVDLAPLPWSLGAASLEVRWLAAPADLGAPALAALAPCLLGGVAADLALRARRSAAVGAAGLGLIALYGGFRAAHVDAMHAAQAERGRAVRVAAIHGVRTRATADAPPTAERAAAERAVAEGAALVVLPESTLSLDHDASSPDSPSDGGVLEEAARAALSDLGAAVALGAISRRGARNVVVVLDAEGGLAGARRKRHPFPGGEDREGPWAWLDAPAGAIPSSADTSPIPLRVASADAATSFDLRVATAVCWDDLFPTARDADLLVVAANDGWFEGTAAGEAHLLQARLRALAARRPMLRATNHGATTIVDAQGGILARATEGRPYALATVVLPGG